MPLSEILAQMGAAGRRLDHMGAVEAGAGNISVSVGASAEELDLAARFPEITPGTELPLPAPALAGRTVLVTGSGCRLRDVADSPEANVSAFVVDEGGLTGTWYTHPDRAYVRPTSEFNSHLAVHNDQVAQRGVDFQAVIHAQPPYLVQLSHIKDIRNTTDFNRRILRWEPETIVQIPAGIEVLDFMVPGSQELMENNVRALRDHVIVLWSKHGIMVRSDVAPLAAVDKVEYAETGAMYEIRNITSGGLGEGVTDAELHAVVEAFNVDTDLF
ncbi:class II aldolase/adducin family protein [Actinomyces sp. MRS3W]|uniref:class II aldolase/adducin family protein n=1 Tax=Actinomyces sp. MRS3W TaxID=2800796 RepID=UPI0028FDB779|nr:class II aldolase/adducin family protein [Actinomyces sp. MRS3W]MDU0348656.1 class II aldolase/adducin family protein [Actinomyces sp. MRS3W]